jgi:hypothetical protein
LTGTQVSESGGEMQMSGKNTGGQEGDVEMVVDAEAS